jgi:hypothetical protein
LCDRTLSHQSNKCDRTSPTSQRRSHFPNTTKAIALPQHHKSDRTSLISQRRSHFPNITNVIALLQYHKCDRTSPTSQRRSHFSNITKAITSLSYANALSQHHKGDCTSQHHKCDRTSPVSQRHSVAIYYQGKFLFANRDGKRGILLNGCNLALVSYLNFEPHATAQNNHLL